MIDVKFLDCTLRDGGYYNTWNFCEPLINRYLLAMKFAGVDVVELGFRSLKNTGFKGACAFTTDIFVCDLAVPEGLQLAVMINGSELLGELPLELALEQLFPNLASDSPVELVRIACHAHEFVKALPAVNWLVERGYRAAFNLMQIADLNKDQVKSIAREATQYPLEALYFADSMGSMRPTDTARIIGWLRSEWPGALGIHTHDNMGLALSNTLCALDEGVTWVDSTVTGMGRGPGNARTEELAIEIAARRGQSVNLVPLMSLLREQFKPLQAHYGWGTNPYYYLAGKYGIHPTYIQEMLNDARYDEEDVLAVIDHLRQEGGKKFSLNTLDAARHFYRGIPTGQWMPETQFKGRDVLLLGTGPSVAQHRAALERYVCQYQPLVLALNTQTALASDLIDLRIACHPVRLLADCDTHVRLPQPLITPYSMLPEDVQTALVEKDVLDFGLNIEPDIFRFERTHCTTPTSLVVAYALAVATSGQANRVLMAGFDGYGADDPRTQEMQKLLEAYISNEQALSLLSVTSTRYNLATVSIYAL
ncbi:aldolase catalytic domain-containing protein [Allochromatium vinosum]|uniref:aldolase catalytic domain-containing protein n=1 Tax=Allochromatium vinosum TaxID=1049 RepID=UPI001907BE14|nr:aldolase catalytic domain-containing protein [Allochromatium vinosum]MBK1654665.1 aldolase [Allochromatium vinosum]